MHISKSNVKKYITSKRQALISFIWDNDTWCLQCEYMHKSKIKMKKHMCLLHHRSPSPHSRCGLASSALWGLQTARRRRAPIPSSIEACQTQMNFQLSIPDPSATNWRLSNQPNFHLNFLCDRDSPIEGGLSEKLGSRSAISETLAKCGSIVTKTKECNKWDTQF